MGLVLAKLADVISAFHTRTVTPPRVLMLGLDAAGKTTIMYKGFFFIVDSSDKSRLPVAREELFNIIMSPDLEGVPVVVMANKQDLPGAASTAEVADALNLRDMRDRRWYVQGACALRGEGIHEGMQEMAKLVIEFQSNIKK